MILGKESKVIFIGYLGGESLSKYALLHCEFLRDYHPSFYNKLWATNCTHGFARLTKSQRAVSSLRISSVALLMKPKILYSPK